MWRKSSSSACSIVRHIAALAVALAFPAAAQAPDDTAAYFRGRTISAIVGFQGGSSSDAYMRTFTRHVGKHLPGQPNVVLQATRAILKGP